MPNTAKEQLQELLRQQTQQANEEAIAAGGQTSAERVENLRRLNELIQINPAVKPAAWKRWPWPIIAFTLALLAILQFSRCAEVEVEMDLMLSELRFDLPAQPKKQKLMAPLQLDVLGVSGLREIQLPYTPEQNGQLLKASEEADLSIRLAGARAGQRAGNLVLESVLIPAATRVWVRKTEAPHQYRLTLRPPPATALTLQANIDGPVAVALANISSRQFDFPFPEPIFLRADSNEVNIDLTFAAAPARDLCNQIFVKNLLLYRIDEMNDLESAAPQAVSTILSGALFFESLNGEQRALRPSEMIQFESNAGEIRTLQLRDERLAMTFHGIVRGMRAGHQNNIRKLMPTWFDWLKARENIWAFGSLAITLISVTLALLNHRKRN